jgi:hypothetical protein
VQLTSPESDSSLINSASYGANDSATLRLPINRFFSAQTKRFHSLNQENAAPVAGKLSVWIRSLQHASGSLGF